VHHLWLEDCFLRWQALTPALEKYVSYPAGVEFSNILGERGVGTDVKERIDEEAARDTEESEDEGGKARAEREEEDASEGADGYPRHHHDSQARTDESEVEGGLMPALDVDVDIDRDVDVDMDSGGGWDGVNPSTTSERIGTPGTACPRTSRRHPRQPRRSPSPHRHRRRNESRH
jgi:hypothetical protein